MNDQQTFICWEDDGGQARLHIDSAAILPLYIEVPENMMLVSTFELLVTRIAPLPANPAGAIARRVVQGYFLTVTNLENRQINLALRLRMADNLGNRVMDTGNTQIISDMSNIAAGGTGTINNTLQPFTVFSVGPSRVAATPVLTIGSPPRMPLRVGHTGFIAALPNIPAVLGPANMEIRGQVELTQARTSFAAVPPARVLITAEIRGTFLDNEYPAFTPSPTNAELDFDQIAYTLPLATGQAANTLEALPAISFPPNLVKFKKDNASLAEWEADEMFEAYQSMREAMK